MKGKIMIVDDTEFMRRVLKNILIASGYDVVAEGSNGAEAVQLYKLVRPDLVTLDITMPVLDGLAALSEIKRIDSQAKVIMCSAMGQKNMVVEAIMAGAKDFIVKPFNEERVAETIHKALV
nr:response regulator [Paenibacillus segetis]